MSPDTFIVILYTLSAILLIAFVGLAFLSHSENKKSNNRTK